MTSDGPSRARPRQLVWPSKGLSQHLGCCVPLTLVQARGGGSVAPWPTGPVGAHKAPVSGHSLSALSPEALSALEWITVELFSATRWHVSQRADSTVRLTRTSREGRSCDPARLLRFRGAVGQGLTIRLNRVRGQVLRATFFHDFFSMPLTWCDEGCLNHARSLLKAISTSERGSESDSSPCDRVVKVLSRMDICRSQTCPGVTACVLWCAWGWSD